MPSDVDHDVLTRTGLHCAPLLHEHYGTAPRGTVRFSIGPFNTKDQILHAVNAVEKIQAATRDFERTCENGLTEEQKVQAWMLSLAELVAKVTYNATNPEDEFDEDSGWWIAVHMRWFIEHWGDALFTDAAWNALCDPVR